MLRIRLHTSKLPADNELVFRSGNELGFIFGELEEGTLPRRFITSPVRPRCKITPPNVIFGFDTFYGVIFMCTFCPKF